MLVKIKIFWDASDKDTYGIREVYRSRAVSFVRGMAWRVYSQRGNGNTIRLSTNQMLNLLNEAEHFVKDRTLTYKKGQHHDRQRTQKRL